MAQTHWKKLTNPNYLGAYSIEDDKPLVLTIRNVKQEVVIGPDGKKDDCIVCYFMEDVKPMILNRTNCTMIEKLAGTPYIEQWKGTIVQIASKRVKAFGDVVDALRIEDKKISRKKAKPIICESCGKPIVAIQKFSAEQIAQLNEKRYGRKICGECSKKLAEEAQKKAEETGADENTEPAMTVSAAELEGQEQKETT